MNIRTRFAPSPTGPLHIGGARTAIFNWLFAKKYNGNFYLRIEDTDKKRSKEEYVESIKYSLKLLGIKWDGDIVFQSNNIDRHLNIIKRLVQEGKAYYCYSTQEEIQDFKSLHPQKKFISKWRDNTYYNKKLHPVVRLKTKDQGSTILKDITLGEIKVLNIEIDDMVLLRSNGTPTYILSSVIDDYDMQITHIIRGNDHLTNTFRQLQIIDALDLHKLEYAHIPLVHDSNGEKVSKRDGALGIDDYHNSGYLPQAIFSYLLRLGWSYNNNEIIHSTKAIDIFNLKNINKSPARFDLNKLKSINQHYIKSLDDSVIFKQIVKKISIPLLDTLSLERIRQSISLIKLRGETITDLAKLALIFVQYANPIDQSSNNILQLSQSKQVLANIVKSLEKQKIWNTNILKEVCYHFAKESNIPISFIMKVLRAGALGTFHSPPIYDSLEIIGKKEVISRILQSIKRNY